MVTFGEAMVRLSVPMGQGLESSPRFDVHVGGAEANVAVVLSRLGFRAAWISKLVDDPLGRRVAGELRQHGVDVSAVTWTKQGRTGLYFVEHAPPPRTAVVYYDRVGSACSTAMEEEIDWRSIQQTRWMHVTGITPALSTSCARIVARMLEEARATGIPVSFDVNYRRKLWTAQQARSTLESLLEHVHLLIATREDAREVLGVDGEPADQVIQLRERWPVAAAITTAGADGVYFADSGGVHHEPALAGAEVDPIGRGDAFAAGVLWGALEGDVRVGLRYGVALSALAQSFHGDVPWCTRQDVLQILAGRASRLER